VILLDVNVLVYAHREETDRHEEYRSWLEEQLDSSTGCAVSDLALSGCLRIITHPRIFNPPTPMEQAIAFVKELREHDNLVVLAPGPRHWQIFIDLCRRSQARGNLVADAYHAALALETGTEWITTDRDYARFPGLRFRHPLDR
jgi:toxin-antitoxin system PIN domain toxin